MKYRPAIGCGEEEARAYLGLSEYAFAYHRRRGVIVPVQKGCYSYNLLDRAMRILEEEALAKANNKCEIIHICHEDNSSPKEEPAGDLGSQGPRPSYPKTQELLSNLK